MANFTKYFISNRCFNTINGRDIQSQFMLVTALYYFHEMINPVTLPSISENDPLKTNQADFENDPAAKWPFQPHDQSKAACKQTQQLPILLRQQCWELLRAC